MKRQCWLKESQRVWDMDVVHRVNALGGYGRDGEVIYESAPSGCPSVLVDNRGAATATFASNGSIGFDVELPDFGKVPVLEQSFDAVTKRETGVPAADVWLELDGGRHVAMTARPEAEVRWAADVVGRLLGLPKTKRP